MKGIRAFLSCVVLAVILGAAFPCSSAELGGYTFADDSIDLYLNPYFSDHDRPGDFITTLYGYGDFAGYEVLQGHHQYYELDGIPCNVILERGYFPDFSSGSVKMTYYTAYHYYAKDTQDNIHLLKYVFYPNKGQGASWSYEDLPEGATTVKYPADPQPGQEVVFGSVAATGISVGDIRGCATIVFDSLPHAPSKSVTEYLVPGSGILASSFNWEGGINGFSHDAGAPEHAEEEDTAWKEWWDDHCFISACSPRHARSCGYQAQALESIATRLQRELSTLF